MSSNSRSNRYVADTVALIVHLEQREMGHDAKAIFNALESEDEAGNVEILVPSAALFEIMYLHEKGRIETSLTDVESYFTKYSNCREMPLDLKIIRAAREITDGSDLHDRLIAGTARWINAPLLTSDRQIGQSKFVTTI